jgi:O-antigen ligase
VNGAAVDGQSAHRERLSGVLAWFASALLLVLVLAHVIAVRHLLTALVLICVVLQLRRRGLHAVPLRAPVIAWLAFTLASYSWSALPAMTADAWLDEAFYPLLLFTAFYLIGSKAQHDIRIAAAVFSSIACLFLLSLEGFSAVAADVRTGVARYYPGVGQASTFAAFAIPALVSMWFHGLTMKALALTGLAFCLAVGLFSLNRMFWPAALATLLLCSLGIRTRRTMRAFLLGAGALAALAVVGAGTVDVMRNAPQLLGRYADAVARIDLEEIVENDDRPGLWRAWLGYAAEHPLIGIGFGQQVPKHYLQPKHPDDPVLAGRYTGHHAHNLLLNTMLQTGLAGVSLLLWLLGALLLRFLRSRAHQPLAAWAGIALLTALLLKNTTDDFMRDAVAMYFWSLAGWLLARAERRTPAASPAWNS